MSAWLNTAKGAAEWFAKYGATLDDAQSYRHQIGFVTKEIEEWDALLPDFRLFLPDTAVEIEAEIAGARILIDLMEKRLAKILSPAT